MKSKKLLSIILALAMMFSVLPASTILVYADEITETISADTTWNDGDTVGGVTISGGTVTINGDVGITAAITIKGDVTFTGGGTLNRMSTSGNLIKVESGSLTLGNVTIDGNDVIISDSGAAAAINMAGGTVIMNDGTKLTNHKRTSGYGPAVYMTGGNFKMKGGTISGCESRNYGGAIYLDGGSFEMNGGIIENNKTTLSSAGYGGGAFYVREASLIIDDGLIQNNSSNSGGAIYNTSFGTTIINGGVIKGNAAVGDSPSGSAIFHSCKTTGEATLQIGGNANINVGNDIYLMSNTSATKYVEITSSIKNPLILTVEGESEGRVIADAADGVVLTYNDMAKIRLSNSSYALKLENNQIKLTQTSSGETKFPVYLGYDANNGTNAPDGSSAEIVAGNSATFTISDSVPTRTGYNFLGWATNKDATSAEYSSGGSITISSNTTLYAVWKKISTFETNEFTQPLAITGWTYGETANTPTAVAKYGTIKYTYSNTADGTYTEEVPTNAGTYYVKATVEETADYSGLESNAVEFTILPKTINTAITQLTAPVKNEVPQTEIETDEYTATVVWSPEVTDKFVYNTVYTATITITPKTNYTVKGIAENGYTVSGAQTVTNEADSATVTVVYPATENKNSNEFTQPLTITGWTYGETANAPTAEAKYGTIKYTYSNTADGTYTEKVPTNAGTHYVKATVEETADYSGLESDAFEFVIEKKTLTNDNITDIADQTYTGGEIKPTIEVKDGDKTLVLDTDYTVTYDNNTDASDEAKVTVEIISNNYAGTLEKTFTILPKTINTAITQLTAPVKNEVPQTEIETDEYTATVVWSPEVTDKFVYNTVYTATITITPKTNYTVKGIAENGYTVSGAQTVTNEADSATITAVYEATGSKSSGGSGRTKRYTVSFNTNGGNKITSQTVAKDNSVKEPTAPIKENFEFAGWYTDKELTTKYDFTEKVTKSFTLYAKWTEQKQENGGSEDVVNNNSGNENKESSDTIVLTIDEHDALVYGTTKTNDVAPKVVNDRTMLPARFIAENLGATVEWDGEKQLVTITGKNEKQEDVTILITIGSDYAKVNGEDVKLDSPAFVENDRTYTPIRFISENLGATVEWNETEQTVTIQRVK
ncbi:MAG: stalk domain-containing protein [Oscillospiraceae bacterium]